MFTWRRYDSRADLDESEASIAFILVSERKDSDEVGDREGKGAANDFLNIILLVRVSSGFCRRYNILRTQAYMSSK